MNYQSIFIDDLIINPNNDRHGETPNEQTAINWLLENKPKEMKRLAENIAVAGRVFDSPMVIPQGQKHLVKDGNRRVTCLKLIRQPSKATQKLWAFFSNLNRDYANKLSEKIECQVEIHEHVADEIIGLRHGGTQGGKGQVTWGTKEKAIHANRTSGKSDYEWPQLVEQYLSDHGHADLATAIKRSTLERVLGAKKRRTLLGLGKGDDESLVSIVAGFDPLPLLMRFASDMKADRLTLKETLVAKDLDKYLARLNSEGLLPKKSSNDPPPTGSKPGPVQKPVPPRPHPPIERPIRDTLIPRGFNFQFKWTSGQAKIQLIWEQLQHELGLEKHKLSAAVMFRVLLKQVAQNYQNRNEM